MKDIELGKLAEKAKAKAHAPFSNFHVGAALTTKDGKVYEGANIENSSYGLTVCAERTAVFQAVLQGEKEFDSIAIASDFEEYTPPCGACRQVLLDLCGTDLNVILINHKDEIKKFKLGELIPHSFGENYLK